MRSFILFLRVALGIAATAVCGTIWMPRGFAATATFGAEQGKANIGPANGQNTDEAFTYPVEGGGIFRKSITYIPNRCHHNANGMIYFALGRRVFAQPAKNLFDITHSSWVEDAPPPIPTDLSEQEGCPDHPIQEAVYRLYPVAPVPEERKQDKSEADEVSVELRYGSTPAFTSEKLFDLMCKEYALRDNTKPDLIGCRKPFKCDADVVYQTQEYRTPLGDKLSFFCSVGASCAEQPVGCEGEYKLYHDVTLHFKFVTRDLPIQDFIDADREIRRRLISTEIPAR